MKKSIAIFVSTFLVSVASVSAFQTSSSELLDFSGWTHGDVAGDGGQEFLGICGDINVTVSADGIFTADSKFISTTDGIGGIPSIQTQLDPTVDPMDPAKQVPAAAQMFTFEFSDPISLVLDLDLLDSYETLEVTADAAVGSGAYSHFGGAMPKISTMVDGGLMLQGTAVGTGTDGAAYGNIKLGETKKVTIKYSSLTSNFPKHGAFLLGKAVPEPSAMGLLLMGLASLWGIGRRSRD